MAKWSDWVNIKDKELMKRHLRHLGIYRIRTVTPSGKPIPIKRLVGVDTLGIIYIGCSGYSAHRSIGNRIREFRRGDHSGGKAYIRAKKSSKECRHFRGIVLR